MSNYDLNSLMKLAKGKTPEELLGSLPKEQAQKVRSIMNDKTKLNNILNSKEANKIIKQMKNR